MHEQQAPSKYGFLPPVIDEAHHLFGAAPWTAPIINPSGQWDEWIPDGETQNRGLFEPCACTNFGSLNQLEFLISCQFGKKENFSDRFSAIDSGTDPNTGGNSPHAVMEKLRKDGVCHEAELPYDSTIDTVEKFYSPKPLPPNLYAEAKRDFLDRFSYRHDWVASGNVASPAVLKEALKYSPLGVAVYAWAQDGEFYVRGGNDNHWCVLCGYEDGNFWKIFDSYDNTKKKLEWNFEFRFVKRIALLPASLQEQVSWLQQILNKLTDIWNSLWKR